MQRLEELRTNEEQGKAVGQTEVGGKPGKYCAMEVKGSILQLGKNGQW